jgi:chromosome segregation protein
MLLTKIEINGFKSFAQKTVLNFSESQILSSGNGVQDKKKATGDLGVTAIVGPNGSGKSNVADALKWVMGEQSMKSLRGKKSSDIIFAGSDSKSRLGSAQVSIYLDNSDKSLPIDYEEVVITRKIYQSGESEYLINKSRVRLGDVLELLAKAGVGQRSYSIVDQGMADRLLNATPIERRVMIEEAAGVKGYQMKKEKSQRKLKSTVKNLERSRELLAEIEPHLRLLKRQYNKAQKGEVYLEELKEKQKRLYNFLWRGLTREKDEYLKKQSEVEAVVSKLQKEIYDLSDQIKQESQNAISHQGEINALEKKKRELSQKLNNLERELAMEEGRVELEKDRLRQIRKTISVPVDSALIKKQLEEIKKKQEEFLGRLDKTKDLTEIEKLKKYAREIIAELQNLYEAVIKGKVEKKRPQAEIGRQLKENEIKMAKLTERIDRGRKKRNEVVKKVEGISRKIEDLIEKDNAERRASIEMEDELRQKRFEIDKLKTELNSYQIELAKLEVKEEDLRGQIMSELKISPEKLLSIVEKDILRSDKEDGKEKRTKEKKEKMSIKESEVAEYSQRIYWLKMQLEQIGGIDEEVIEEYKETQQRYDFLVRESEDLQEAMKKLEKVIKEMDEQIKGKFARAYRAINKEFQKYFKIIFNGGRAKLEQVEIVSGKKSSTRAVTGNEDELEVSEEEEEEKQVGVEVVVNPPGKKIANVGMLSGGERTLTSLALLFAIIAYNPPPFALLDEVEAALDEANSRRFGKILSELANQTQFILITHNRQVMKEASLLYGVTMRGDGVSELLSIKLEGAEKYAE